MMTETVPKQAVAEVEEPRHNLNPWLFVPLLYFMQAIPVAIVQELATIFYKDMGIANEPITRWTSLISLPWSLQLMLGPLVDLNFTKRRWILGGQALCAAGIIGTAFLLKVPNAFELSLVVLGATAIVSALCNIATDGFYIISLSKEQQAKFVGIQSTCYRLGRLFCVGILVQMAGKIASVKRDDATGRILSFEMDPMIAWTIVIGACGGIYLLGHLLNRITVPKPPQDRASEDQDPAENRNNVFRTFAVVGFGVGTYFTLNAVVRLLAHGLWSAMDGSPEGKWKGWMLPATSDLFGVKLPGITAEIVQLAICGVIALACFAASKKSIANTKMGDAFASFVRLPGIVSIFFFVLFYRFGEAMVSKMSPLFLKDPLLSGGLAIPTEQVGVIKGYFGVIGIVAGGLCGAAVVGKFGLRKSILPLALCMHIPNLLYLMLATMKVPLGYVYLGSYFSDVPLTLVGIDFVDQFGYGFGFAAYMVYLMQVAGRGSYKTAHFAIGTGMGALCIAIAGIVSGIIQSNFGYPAFFVAVLILSIPGVLTLFFIPLDDKPKPQPA